MKATVKFNGKEYDAVLIEKKVESERWKPETNESYYSVDGYGDIDRFSWDNDRYDNFGYSQRNVFKTKEEAQKHLEYLKSLAILRDDAGDCEPNWDNHSQNKYSIRFDHRPGGLGLYIVGGVCLQSLDIYFETEEAAQKSIDEHKEHWLRVFGVNDD